MSACDRIVRLLICFSFMIEGLEADDRYRMVEDELLSVAQQFTAHLHAVEYQRLRETLKSRNARTVQDIPRPVVGSMTGLVRRKQERKAHAEKQRLALKETLGNHDDTDGQSDHYRDTSLYGLMENPMKKATRLDKLPITSTATRAAAGFEESSYRQIGIPQTVFNRLPGSRPKKDNIQSEIRDETSSGDDDLDGPAPGAVPEHIPRLHESIVQPAQTQTKLEAAKNQAPTGNSMDASEKATLRRSRSELSDSSDDAVGDFFSRLQNRRASLKSNRERRKHGSSGINREPSNHDVIPGFL